MNVTRILIAAILATSVACADDAPVTSSVWTEAVVSVTDIDRSARFFTEIGGYEEKWRGRLDDGEFAAWGLPVEAGGEALLLGPPGSTLETLKTVASHEQGLAQCRDLIRELGVEPIDFGDTAGAATLTLDAESPPTLDLVIEGGAP